MSAAGRSVSLGAAKQRALLAMLAIHANRTLSADELMDGLWGEPLPRTAPKMVQQYVSQLRRLLADGRDRDAEILTRGRGYELRIDPEDVDAWRFERLVDRGEGRAALALWRGPPLTDVADEPFAAEEIRRLEALRLRALEQAIDADLDAGRHVELVPELEGLVGEQPLSERVHGQLMLALYRSQRQGDALAVYRDVRTTLVGQLGLEPGPPLRRLQEAILHQDPALDPPRRLSSRPSWRRRPRWPAARRSSRSCVRCGSGRAPARP
jgi:DNA-binding SARP family transcriptional activator